MANTIKNDLLAEEIVKCLRENGFDVHPNEDVVAIVNQKVGGTYFINLEQEHDSLPVHIVVGVMMKASDGADIGELREAANKVNDMFVQGKMVVDEDRVVRLFVGEADGLVEDFVQFFSYAFQTVGIMAGTVIAHYGELFDVK